ncbi:sigma-70 family RNA polymerase sigma factor [Microbulbifer salipaludis]|uniref:Sigma-70 family RNA polymerase sigma factor n=1 Tax=Microbulbifer salipaludis TaxID=187980 RepID=A0ABS3E9M1_9GAMM|nr:sigma-70 family RNA polymerase sigma factor [Microbulbifer salipaludis]MBN8432012.1 sigma-70 family RNA polymerase sigma factor [Microbulbifer salipaludis]
MFTENLCSLSDEDLVSRFYEARHHKVFQEIYLRYKDQLFRYCAQMAPEYCVSAMESFWKSFLDAPPKLYRQQLKNWLYIRLCRTLRSPSANRDNPQAEEARLSEALASSSVLSAIQTLPRQQRNIFLLVTECGLSLATAADIEQIPLSTCRALLQQGREHMEHALNGSARKPWKSAATLAREAAAQAQRADEPATEQRGNALPTPTSSSPIFSWKKSPNLAPASAAGANRSVEVV